MVTIDRCRANGGANAEITSTRPATLTASPPTRRTVSEVSEASLGAGGPRTAVRGARERHLMIEEGLIGPEQARERVRRANATARPAQVGAHDRADLELDPRRVVHGLVAGGEQTSAGNGREHGRGRSWRGEEGVVVVLEFGELGLGGDERGVRWEALEQITRGLVGGQCAHHRLHRLLDEVGHRPRSEDAGKEHDEGIEDEETRDEGDVARCLVVEVCDERCGPEHERQPGQLEQDERDEDPQREHACTPCERTRHDEVGHGGGRIEPGSATEAWESFERFERAPSCEIRADRLHADAMAAGPWPEEDQLGGVFYLGPHCQRLVAHGGDAYGACAGAREQVDDVVVVPECGAWVETRLGCGDAPSEDEQVIGLELPDDACELVTIGAWAPIVEVEIAEDDDARAGREAHLEGRRLHLSLGSS